MLGIYAHATCWRERFKLRGLVLLLLWLNFGCSTSVIEDHKIPDPYTVDDVSVLTKGENVTIEIRLGSSDLASNLRRRQWAKDPIGAEALKRAAIRETILNDGEELFAYLVHNSTLEDSSEILFKLELTPRSELEQPEVKLSGPGASQLALDPAPKAYVGKAYRQVTPIWPPTAPLEWREVGNARATIDGEDALAQFEVDDEQGLGVPSANYKLATKYLQPAMRSLSPRFAVDQPLLWCDKSFEHLTGPLGQYNFLKAKSRVFKGRKSRRSDTTDSDAHGSLYGSIGNSTGCPSQKKVALVGAAVDCNFLGSFNSTANARLHVMDSYTSASPWLESAFNVALGLGELYVPSCTNSGHSSNSSDLWDYGCSSDTNSTALTDRLGMFSTWRQSRAEDNFAGWTMWTSCGSSSTVGLSQTGALCNQNAGCSLVKSTGSNDPKVLAHELGHTFGAVHDCTSATCSSGSDSTGGCCPLASDTCNANGGYLMNPAVTSATSFSPCTIGEICTMIGSGLTNTTCLRSSGSKLSLVTPNICGNGIVEEGEECDCGGVEGCGNNSCCDPTTCKFTTGSVCDDSNAGCCKNCQFASKGTVCANTTGDCISPATCDGSTAVCPAAQKVADGTSCSSTSSSLKCYSGKCTSRDQQCIGVVSGTAYDRYGNALTIQGACGDDCTLACSASNTYGSSCYVFYGRSFVDGTPCGSNGHCTSGTCSKPTTDSVFGGFDKWYLLALIAVPVALVLLWSVCCCSRSRKKSTAASNRAHNQSAWRPDMAASIPPVPAPQYRAPPPPPPPYGPSPYYPPPNGATRTYQRPDFPPPNFEPSTPPPSNTSQAPSVPERPINSYQYSPHGFPGR